MKHVDIYLENAGKSVKKKEGWYGYVLASLISFLILSILLGVFGFCFSHSMMRLLQTPADILEAAVLYLRVYFVGFPFLFMYNILSTMFTSIGESKIPLGLLIFSSVLNIFQKKMQNIFL